MQGAAESTVTHRGGCHCGQIRFEVEAPAEIEVAEHLFCSACGIKSFYVPRPHPDGVSVNSRCLDPGTVTRCTVRGFDGIHWEANVGELGEGGR